MPSGAVSGLPHGKEEKHHAEYPVRKKDISVPNKEGMNHPKADQDDQTAEKDRTIGEPLDSNRSFIICMPKPNRKENNV